MEWALLPFPRPRRLPQQTGLVGAAGQEAQSVVRASGEHSIDRCAVILAQSDGFSLILAPGAASAWESPSHFVTMRASF